MKDYEEKVLNIMDSAKDNIKAQLDKAYKSGYEDAKSELGKNVIDLAHKEIDRAYQRGLNEAWEVAKKIVAIYKRHELQNMGFKCDGSDYNFSIIVEDYTAQEAIAKIKEYEEHQKQDIIQVGDEVFYMDENDLRVVVRISNQMDVVQITKDGKCAINDVEELHKTGRTFPQIAEVFTEMRGEE